MSIGLIGRKVGMTQVFAEDGTMVPVSVLAVEPNTVTELRTMERDGYTAVKVGAGTARRTTKPRLGQLKALPRVRDVREFRVDDVADYEADRVHPQKCRRPIASGAVRRGTALVLEHGINGNMITASASMGGCASSSRKPA